MSQRMNIDDIDRKIIKLLQHSADIPVQQLADKINLSKTACWNRLPEFISPPSPHPKGPLKINAKQLGYAIKAMMLIKTNQHDKVWMDKFLRHVQSMPQIVGFYRLTGEGRLHS